MPQCAAFTSGAIVKPSRSGRNAARWRRDGEASRMGAAQIETACFVGAPLGDEVTVVRLSVSCTHKGGSGGGGAV